MSDLERKAFKLLEKESSRYKKDGDIWTISIAKRIIENADNYDTDIIDTLKEIVKRLDDNYEEGK